jgi:hypothetical protein
MRVRTTLTIVALWCATAHADVKVDWARGLVIADAVGVADRHAPNPAIARGTSRRGAEQVAKKQIAERLDDLPLASGGKVAGKAKDKDVKQRLEHAVDAAITLAADPETDGAWKVTMAVPIEAVRQALDGTRPLPETGDAGTKVVVVDGVSAKPAVGYTIGSLAAPTLWVTQLPAWAKDAPHVKAKRAKGGAIEVSGLDAPGINATAATLFVIVTK